MPGLHKKNINIVMEQRQLLAMLPTLMSFASDIFFFFLKFLVEAGGLENGRDSRGMGLSWRRGSMYQVLR